ncbi:MAG TPA: amidase [Bryobacteraceae bacterium]|nr:amidase [Bryobacteraceae bacterium]
MNITADRRRFMSFFAGLGLSQTLFPGVLWAQVQNGKPAVITKDMLTSAAIVAGLTFTDHELDGMVKAMNAPESEIVKLHAVDLPNSVAPPLHFNPVLPGMKIDRTRRAPQPGKPPQVQRPANLEDVAFWPVTHLAELIRTKQAKSTELTEMYLDRLNRYNPKLLCAVTITKDRALRQAREADRQIAASNYKGPLHGIPFGVKDLLAVKGYPTTWGAAPFKTRIIDEDANVVTRLDAAGAVLVAKLTTGELALDDIWFGGQTKNPWDLSMGSQGSSAGPASATSAGLVGFSIGTETGGSIVEPSGICGVTGHRPTYGRVSRNGAMTLAWSLDKIGPMCRAVEDCALVLTVIQGPDHKDLTVQDVPFNWDAQLDIRSLRVGYLKAAFDHTNQTPKTDANDAAALDKLRSLGITLHEIALPKHSDLPLTAIMWSEANAALKDPIRVQPADLVRQDRVANQNSYRLLPAAEYIDANRIRGLLMAEMAKVMADIDVYVVPFDYGDYTPNPVATANTTVTNLTGHPCVVVPHGFNEKGNPTSLTFVGQIFGEAKMLALAKAYQDATDWHLKHPKM